MAFFRGEIARRLHDRGVRAARVVDGEAHAPRDPIGRPEADASDIDRETPWIGEATSIYSDAYVHARSPEGAAHPSQSRVRGLAAQVAYELPAGWRICGENLQATHSIAYHHLPAFFLVISIWNERNECLPWDETVEWCDLLGLTPVEVLYDGPFDEAILRSLHRPVDETGDEVEGWVMRTAEGFAYSAFRNHVAKMVRQGHVATHARHWRRGPIEDNALAASTA